MALQILDAILVFAIFGLVRVLRDLGASRLRPFEMRVNIVDEYCEALSLESGLCGTRPPRARAVEHDPGIAEMHLRTLHLPANLAITAVLREAKCSR